MLHFAGGIAAKQNYTDADIVNFLTNVECIEGQFDTWGAFGFGFVGKSKDFVLFPRTSLEPDTLPSDHASFLQTYISGTPMRVNGMTMCEWCCR